MNEECSCPFCKLQKSETFKPVYQNELAFVINNIDPVTPGHCLVITRRPAKDLSELTLEEAVAVHELTLLVFKEWDKDPAIIGKNQRTNLGPIAGQRVGHFHSHLVPRREGDDEYLTIIGGRKEK